MTESLYIARARRLGFEPTVGNRWKANRCPAECAEVAVSAEALGKWRLAARAWDLAARVSFGHNRTARYRDRAEHCRREAHKSAARHLWPELSDAEFNRLADRCLG